MIFSYAFLLKNLKFYFSCLSLYFYLDWFFLYKSREGRLYFHFIPMGVINGPSIIINIFILSSLICNSLSLKSRDKLLYVKSHDTHDSNLCFGKIINTISSHILTTVLVFTKIIWRSIFSHVLFSNGKTGSERLPAVPDHTARVQMQAGSRICALTTVLTAASVNDYTFWTFSAPHS